MTKHEQIYVASRILELGEKISIKTAIDLLGHFDVDVIVKVCEPNLHLLI